MIIKDIWGNIEIEEEYQQIIESKEFQELKNKNQLELNTNVGATHKISALYWNISFSKKISKYL